jgi:hypothetical protein
LTPAHKVRGSNQLAPLDAINMLDFITVFVLFGFRTRTPDPPLLSWMNSTPEGRYARIGMFFFR